MGTGQWLWSAGLGLSLAWMASGCADSNATSTTPAEAIPTGEAESEENELQSVGSKPGENRSDETDAGRTDEGSEENSSDGATAEEETLSDAADEAENGPEEDAAEVVIEEDGGIGGSGIYPPKPIPEQVGGERPADVLVPVDYNPETSYPLILQLHGYSSDSEQIDTYFNLSAYVSLSPICPDHTRWKNRFGGQPILECPGLL